MKITDRGTVRTAPERPPPYERTTHRNAHDSNERTCAMKRLRTCASLVVVAILASSSWSLPTRAEEAHSHDHPPQSGPAQAAPPAGAGTAPATQQPSGTPSQHTPQQSAQSPGHQPGQGQAADATMMMKCPMMSMMQGGHGQHGSGSPATPSNQSMPSSQAMGTMMQGMGMMMQGMGMMMQGMGTPPIQAPPRHH